MYTFTKLDSVSVLNAPREYYSVLQILANCGKVRTLLKCNSNGEPGTGLGGNGYRLQL